MEKEDTEFLFLDTRHALEKRGHMVTLGQLELDLQFSPLLFISTFENITSAENNSVKRKKEVEDVLSNWISAQASQQIAQESFHNSFKESSFQKELCLPSVLSPVMVFEAVMHLQVHLSLFFWDSKSAS